MIGFNLSLQFRHFFFCLGENFILHESCFIWGFLHEVKTRSEVDKILNSADVTSDYGFQVNQ